MRDYVIIWHHINVLICLSKSSVYRERGPSFSLYFKKNKIRLWKYDHGECFSECGAQIGHHVIINTNASVDHDCVQEDFVHISPQAGLAGNVSVGDGLQLEPVR